MKSHYLSILFVLIICLLCSCQDYVCDDYTHFDKETWNMEDTTVYDFNIDDVESSYTIKFNMEIGDEYKYRNLYLFTKTIMPDMSEQIDTLQFILSAIDGKSYSKSISGRDELEFLMNKNAKFIQKGNYSFQVIHGMRDDELQGVKYVGFVITKNK